MKRKEESQAELLVESLAFFKNMILF